MNKDNTILFEDIVRKRRLQARLLVRTAQKNERKLKIMYIQKVAAWEWDETETARLIARGQYTLRKHLRNTARAIIAKLPENPTPFQVEKLLQDEGEIWEETLETSRAPFGVKEEELDAVLPENRMWNGLISQTAIDNMEKTKEQARMLEWKEINAKTPYIPGKFYLVAHIYMGDRALHYDSRDNIWIKHHKTGKRMKVPRLALWKKTGDARLYIISQLIEKYYGKELKEKLDVTSIDILEPEEAKAAMLTICEELDMIFVQSQCLVDRMHDGKEGDFPALYFGMQPKLTAKTKYAYSPMMGIHEAITHSPDMDDNVQRAIRAPFLTGYELEDKIIKGAADNIDDELKGQGFEEKYIAQKGDIWRGREPVDLEPGLAEYASFCLNEGLEDLYLNACEASPSISMTVEIAHALWEEHISIEAGIELWGKYCMRYAVEVMNIDGEEVEEDIVKELKRDMAIYGEETVRTALKEASWPIQDKIPF